MNAAAISLWPLGEERQMSEWLLDVGKNLSTKAVYKDWGFGGTANGLLQHSGLYNSDPLVEFLSGIYK